MYVDCSLFCTTAASFLHFLSLSLLSQSPIIFFPSNFQRIYVSTRILNLPPLNLSSSILSASTLHYLLIISPLIMLPSCCRWLEPDLCHFVGWQNLKTSSHDTRVFIAEFVHGDDNDDIDDTQPLRFPFRRTMRRQFGHCSFLGRWNAHACIDWRSWKGTFRFSCDPVVGVRFQHELISFRTMHADSCKIYQWR